MEKTWVFNITDSEVWNSAVYKNKEDCIKDGKEEAIEAGVNSFDVGEIAYVKLSIDAEEVIERLQEGMYDFVGEVSETYLSGVKKDQVEDLSNRLTDVFDEWLKEYKHDERYYTIIDVEEIEI